MQKTLFVRIGTHYRKATGVELLEAASYVEARHTEDERPSMAQPKIALAFLRKQLAHAEVEYFAVMYLDIRYRMIAFEKMFRGTIDTTALHPREIVREVLSRNAAVVILAHNHPSGEAIPSTEDIRATRRIVNALALIDVRVLDHIIIGEGQAMSFSMNGLMPEPTED